MTRKIVLALALLPLSACIKFGSEPPPSLLTLAPAAKVPVGETRRAAEGASPIVIAVPGVPQELATTRVPVHSDANTVAYLKDAQWVEQPARLFARVLGDTIAARTGRLVLTPRQAISDPGVQLGGELLAFGIDAQTSEAVVTYDASLQRPGAKGYEKRRFEARLPVAELTPLLVSQALDTAANRVAGEVADWVGR
ncbi:MAG: ABC-type transport auxiliary lipoprotein family protein [Pseudomonadota bacterium]